MSFHGRLVGSGEPSFLNRFFDLSIHQSVADLFADQLIKPLSLRIDEGIDEYPILTRVSAPLLAGSYGLVLIATATALLAESVFKALGNFLAGIFTCSGKRLNVAVVQLAFGLYGTGFLCIKGLASATIGLVSLAVLPDWTFRRIISF